MTTPASMSELSTTAASNNPSGSDAPSTIDDQIRALAAIVRQNVTKGSDIASASAITIPASGNYFVVTGTTGITSITDTNSWYGREVVLKFSGALTITHSANLILPGAANITTVAGDVAHFVSESSGVWRCTDYTRSSAAATASGLTMATSRLLGRTTASTGAIEEISVSGATLSGGVLTIGLPRSYLAGLGMANGTDATNDIDIAVGTCRDSTNAADITLGSAITKQLDAAWAVGTNQGGLDTGSIANTTYHVWLIKRSDTGVVDALFSTSATSPTMPTNYDYKRRIGTIIRAAGAIRLFTQRGNLFLLTTPVQDSSGSVGTSRSTISTTCPPNTIGRFRFYGYNSGAVVNFVLQPTAETDAAPSGTATPGISLRAEVANQGTAGEYDIPVDASSQIAARASVAASTLQVVTIGWIDTRGRDD